MGFSDFSVLVVPLSVEDDFLEGGFGVCDAGTVSGLEVLCPFVEGCELILFSDLIASFVENIRVSRFVIDGFSDCGARFADFSGSGGGAA